MFHISEGFFLRNGTHCAMQPQMKPHAKVSNKKDMLTQMGLKNM
jgi:hypothetical protein